MMISSVLSPTARSTALALRPVRRVHPVSEASTLRVVHDDWPTAAGRGYFREYLLPKGHLVDITA